MYDLIPFWLYQCRSFEAYKRLSKYGYKHDLVHGDIGAIRANVSGFFIEPDEQADYLIAQAVWYNTPSVHNYVPEPVLYDIIAWHPDRPNEWYFTRGEHGLVLGYKALWTASMCEQPLLLHSTPLEWLLAGCEGSVLLDSHATSHLYGLSNIICPNLDYALLIEVRLTNHYKQNTPSIAVRQSEAIA